MRAMNDQVMNQSELDELLASNSLGAEGADVAAPAAGPEAPAPVADAPPAADDLSGWGLTPGALDGAEGAGSVTAPPGKVQFDAFRPDSTPKKPRDLDFILDIPLQLTVEVGRSTMEIGELLQLGPGSIVELDKLAGEPLEIFANDKLVAHGEAVIVNEKYGIRPTDVVSTHDRIENLH
jgi:flagellar motor switch protein FliN